MRRTSLALYAVLLAASFVNAATAQHRRPTAAELREYREALARERARRDLLRDVELGRITLPEAARLAGGTLVLDRYTDTDCFPQRDVRRLADHSSLIIVGRPFVARVELTDDRRSIVTTYSVQVDDTLKASQLPPFVQNVIIRIPQGRMDFGDGTSAEIRSGPSLALGERYVLFLDDERDEPSGMPSALPGTRAGRTRGATDGRIAIYTPLGAGHGVFHLQADGKTRSYAQGTSVRRGRYDGMREAVFLAEVKAAVAARRVCIACFWSNTVRFSSFKRRITRQHPPLS